MPLPGIPLQIGPWTGSVRYDLAVEEVGAHEMFDMQNARLGKSDQVESRKGTASYKSEAVISGTPTLTMVTEFRVDSSTTEVVIVHGAVIAKYDSGYSAITGSVTATAGDDNTWEVVNANGVLVATNGVDTNAWKWTGAGNASDLDDDARFTKGRHIAWFDNRLWIANVNGATNQVWFSDIADIETWGATSFFNFGGEVLGIVPMRNELVVHTTIGIFTLISTGNATVPYLPNQRTGVTSDAGPLAGVDGRSCVVLPNDTQMCVLSDGIYAYEGGTEIVKKSHQLDGRYWDSINASRLTQAFAGVFPGENEVWFVLPFGATQTNPNSIVCYNYLKDRWHGPYNGWERNCFALIANKPHLGDFGGFLWDHDDDDGNDNGESIVTYAEHGAPAPLGDERVRWLRARHYYDSQGEYSMTYTQLGSDVDGEAVTIDLASPGFILDQDFLDSGTRLADSTQRTQDTKLLDYSTHMSGKLANNAVGEKWSHRKIFLRYKRLGALSKPKPTDT